jgi:hypothetical protein
LAAIARVENATRLICVEQRIRAHGTGGHVEMLTEAG